MQRSMITTLEFYGMGLKSNMVIRLIIFLFMGIGRLLYIYPMQGMIENSIAKMAECNAVSGEYVRLCFATEKTDNEGTTWSRETNGGES